MTKILKLSHPSPFLEEIDCAPITLSPEVYKRRLQKLVDLINSEGLTHAVIYGDREHFSNVEYFSAYDSRFEETLMIVDTVGDVRILLGNEGYSYSMIIPYRVSRMLYQNFSLQGQPRESSLPLDTILVNAGITKNGKVGVVGYKYFDINHCRNSPSGTFDIPSYIVESLYNVCGEVRNITEYVTGLPYGIRSRLYCAEEIAWAQAQANRCAGVVQRMLKNLRPGIKEYELPSLARVGFDPTSVHPLCNFGSASVGLGLRSPTDNALEMGAVCGVCYGIRGNLTSRVSIAALDYDTCKEKLKPFVESFYMKHFDAMAAWYQTLTIGRTGGDLYEAVMNIIGGGEFGVTLNPGHNTGTDEWTNSPCYEGSPMPIVDGSFLQADIIASGTYPNRTAICEDAVVVASEELRGELKEEYPDVYDLIRRRQDNMRNLLNIQISDEVLPMSNLNGAFFPYMLDCSMVFACD